MRAAIQATVMVLAVLCVASGCKPKIGDDCEVDSDCSATGDRLCDRAQPGGYCTIFSCEPGKCPDEAVCIGFRTVVSTLTTEDGSVTGWACYDPQESSRFQRAFCMRSCKSNRDCRSGYECVDMGREGNPYGAIVVEESGTSGKVCAVPNSAEPLAYSGDGIPGVCTGDPGVSFGGATGSGGAVSAVGGSDSGGVAGSIAGSSNGAGTTPIAGGAGTPTAGVAGTPVAGGAGMPAAGMPGSGRAGSVP